MKALKVIFFDLGETLVTKDKKLIAGVEPMLAALHKKGIRLGIISNTAQMKKADVIKSLPADLNLGLFEESMVIFSHEVGVEKPASEIFQMALDQADINAEECLFCTENLLHTLAAQQIGFRTTRTIPPPNSDIADLIESLTTTRLLD